MVASGVSICCDVAAMEPDDYFCLMENVMIHHAPLCQYRER